MTKLGNFFKKLFKKIGNILICVLIAVIGFLAGYFWGHNNGSDKSLKTASLIPAAAEVYDELMVKITPEERNHIEVAAISGRLEKLQELSTYSYEYSVLRILDSSYVLFDSFTVPMTSTKITLQCDGIVKVGYDLSKIGVEVDERKGIIYIDLPDAQINDNYIIWDQVKCDEQASIFNPTDFDTYRDLITEIEADGLLQAEEQGIYGKAEENLKLLIGNSLAVFSDYEVEFR